MFRKSLIINGLAMAGAVLGFAAWIRTLPDPMPAGERSVALRYEPVELPPVEGARLAGAWRVAADDPRFGGLSGAAFDRGRLIAVSDSGSVIRMDLPGAAGPRAAIKPLPAVPGPAKRKIGRDSEALARDPKGRGWWVAFEQRHSLLLYDRDFTRLIARRRLSSAAFRPNRGVEALYAAGGGGLVALPEASGISDAAALDDGRVALLARRFGPTGFESSLRIGGRRIALDLGPLDNPEAVAAAPLSDGATRLWILTDNDFRAGRATLLVAVDLAPAKRR